MFNEKLYCFASFKSADSTGKANQKKDKKPFFRCDITLVIPNIQVSAREFSRREEILSPALGCYD